MMKTTKKKVTILLKEMVDALASMAKAKSLSLSLQTRISALKLRLMLFSLLRDRRFQVGTIPNNLHSLLNRRRRNHHHHNNNKLEQQKHEQQMMPILNDETQFHGDAEDDKRVVLFYCDDGDSGKSEASVVVNYCDGKSDAGASNLGLAEANRVDTEPEEEVNPVSEEWLEEAAVATAAEVGEEEDVLEGDAEKVLDELEFVVEDGGDRDNVADQVFDEMKLGDNPTASGPAVNQVVNEIEAESDGGGGDWLQKSTKEEEDEEEFELEDKIDEVADLFIKRFHAQMRMERSPIHH